MSSKLASEGWPEIGTTFTLNIVIGAALLLLFELKRDKTTVYGRRLDKTRHRTPDPPPFWCFGWLMPVWRMRGKDILDSVGPDAYLLLSFEWMCLMICVVSSFWGMLLLAPLYASDGNQAAGFYQLTMINVPNGGTTLWASTVFAYLLTAHVLYMLNKEYLLFSRLRQDFLCYGDPDLLPQARYSIMVELLPEELRSGISLHAYFDAMFPGQVFSAVICQDVRELEKLVAHRGKLVRRLERVRSLRLQAELDACASHDDGACDLCSDSVGPSLDCSGGGGGSARARAATPGAWGITSGVSGALRDELARLMADEKRLWAELETLNERVAQEQAKALAASERLNSSDNEVLVAIKRRAKRSLRSLGELLGAGRLTSSRHGSSNDAAAGDAAAAPAAAAAADTAADTAVEAGGTATAAVTGDSGARPDPAVAAAAKAALENPSTSSALWSDDSTGGGGGGGGGVDEEAANAEADANFERLMRAAALAAEAERATAGGAAAARGGLAADRYGTRGADGYDVGTAAAAVPGSAAAEAAWHRWREQAGAGTEADVVFESQSMGSWLHGVWGGFVAALRSIAGLAIPERVSSTGFVTFNTLAAKAAASQLLVTHRPRTCRTYPAPEPRDVVWKNAAVPAGQVALRGIIANVLLAFGAILWSVPITALQAWTSMDQLSKWIPALDKLNHDGYLYTLVSGYLPVLVLLILIMLLPVIFTMIAQGYELRKTISDVQASVMSRFFYYQLANIYITVASGTILEAFQSIVDNPKEVATILGTTLPSVAVYFVNLVLVKTLSGLPMELSRLWPLITVTWSQRCGGGRLCAWVCCCCRCWRGRPRRQRRRTRGAYTRGAFTPPQMAYGWVYPTLLLVLVVCLVYAVITPVMMPVGAAFFAVAYAVHKFQVLYVYVPAYESGGSFWFDVHDWTLVGLVTAQITLLGYTTLRSGFKQTPFLVVLPIVTLCYRSISQDRYRAPSQRLSLERARQLDERIAATHPDGASQVFKFDALLYSPPALKAGPAEPEPLTHTPSPRARRAGSAEEGHCTPLLDACRTGAGAQQGRSLG